MIQHMNLVFQAEGLSVGEGAFLMACCNHTDDRGYVIAHMQQIADEAHMSLRSAQDQKKRLIKRQLLATKERYSPKNRARIADLYRVNLDLLTSMRRQRKDYGPSLVEELTFDEPSQDNPSSDPGADSAPPPADSAPPPAKSAGDGGAKSAPLLLPSSSPSSLSGEAGGEQQASAAPEASEEREIEDANNNGSQAVDQAAGLPVVEALAAQWRAVHGTAPGRRQLDTIAADAADALASGDSREWLVTLVVPFMVARRYLDLGRAKTHPQCPVPTAAAGTARVMCPKHPRYPAGDRCVPCVMA